MKTWARVSISVCGIVIATAATFGFYSGNVNSILSADSELRRFPSNLEASSRLPYDVDEERVKELVAQDHRKNGVFSPDDSAGLVAAQREFDILTWQAFLALNWPQKTYGEPEPDINDTHGEPLWRYWIPSQKIFLPGGATPSSWNAEKQVTEATAKDFVLFKTKAAWRQNASADDNFQAFSGPLVDQNGKWARYEALVDEEEFNYILENKLYNLDGQIEFSQRRDNNEVNLPVNEGTRKHGAIEIKLAWKELGANDDPKRFYTKQINVKVSGPDVGGKPQTRTINAGLVGMHIAMRTQSSPEWIWATFEQVDNERQNKTDHGLSHANFMNPHLKNVPVNILPAKNADCTPPGSKTNCTTWYESLTKTPVQVERVVVPIQPGLNPVDDVLKKETDALNREVQDLLRENHSVLQFYELIGTQWPVRSNAPAFAGGQGSAPESITNKTPGDMVPVFLVNTTMETYFQKGKQAAGALEQDDRLPDNSAADSTSVIGTESCIGCHYSAGICTGYKRNVDGSPALASNGGKIPVFGENGHFGRTAHGNFSWMLQIEASSPNLSPPSATPRLHRSGIKPNVQP